MYDDHYMYDDYYYMYDDPYMIDDPYMYDDDPYMYDDTYGDDRYMMDDPYVGVPMWVPTNASTFLDARYIQDPVYVYPDPVNQDQFLPGTVYLYSEAGLLDIETLNEGSPGGAAHGKCTRTDPFPTFSEDYLGKAYCQFTIDLFDDYGTAVASFTAEGPVMNGPVSTLAITGGSGELRKVVGQVDLIPSFVDNFSFPPASTPDGFPYHDFLAEVDGYEMHMYLWVDASLIF